MIENRQLRYFVTAARLLHITRAAEALHIAQPALTRNIHQLEEELEVALFHRVRKRISLTDAGQIFLVEAERLLQQLEESTTAAQKAARGELGRLVIGFVSTAGLVAVPKLIAAFRKRYPGPRIVLKELESEELYVALRNGIVDVGLQYGPWEEGELSVRLLEADHFVVALPHDHRFATADRVNLRDLADDLFVIPNRATGGPMTDAILEECLLAGFRPRTGHEITTTTIQTTLGLVSASIGVSLIPNALWPFSRNGVVFRPISKTNVALHLNLLWRPQNTAAVLHNFLSTVDGINAP
jgi:DNA-binding transcriptional LysR family regulator